MQKSIRFSKKNIARIKRAFSIEKTFLKIARENFQPQKELFREKLRRIVERKQISEVRNLEFNLIGLSALLYNCQKESRRLGRLTGITEALEMKQYYQRKKNLEAIPIGEFTNRFVDKATSALNPLFSGLANRFSVVPQEALNYYQDYSVMLSGIEDEYILKSVKIIIYSAIDNGLSVQDTMSQLESVLNNYESYRLERIARTEVSRAINQGRIESFKAPELEGFLVGMQFFAVTDDRICDTCESRDGLIMPIGDMDKAEIPPLHVNCRCCFVPLDKYSAVLEGLTDKIGVGWENLTQPAKGFGGK